MKIRRSRKNAETVAEVFDNSPRTPVLELMDGLSTIPLGTATIGVVRSVGGICPLGFQPGKTWSVDSDGHLSRPLCRPAVDAISTALWERDEEDLETGIVCHCPIGDQNLVFSVERPT